MRARDLVASVVEGADQVSTDQTDPFEGDSVRHRMVARSTVGLEAMREGVHAGRRGEKGRKSKREQRIGDDEIGLHAGVKDDLLVLFDRVDDDCRASDFRAGSRSSRYCDRWQDLIPVCSSPVVADVLVVEHGAGVMCEECDAFPDIHRRTAADQHAAVRLVIRCCREAGLDVCGRGVGLDRRIDVHREAAQLECRHQRREPVEFENARVRHDERARDAEFDARIRQLAYASCADSIGGRIVEVANEGVVVQG